MFPQMIGAAEAYFMVAEASISTAEHKILPGKDEHADFSASRPVITTTGQMEPGQTAFKE